MIKFDQVEVRYDDFVALPAIDLTIEEGEFFTLLGPSGCGKSTALRTLAGFVTPSSGKILIRGRDVTTAASHKRGVGMVFQNYALFPSMNVWDNIAFGPSTAKMTRAEVDRRVNEVAERVDLNAKQLNKPVTALSGGQQQRVAIARALVMKPEILLLDEPLSNLDAKLRQQLRIQLKELQQQFGITTLYVTHDQEEALSMSDRIAVMNAGRIEQVGTPKDLYDRSATEFVCTFLGEANHITSSHVHTLNSEGAGLDPTVRYFLRIEKGALTPSTETSGRLNLRGTVLTQRYHGTVSSFDIDCGGDVVRVLAQETGHAQVAQGDAVTVNFHPKHLLAYAADGVS